MTNVTISWVSGTPGFELLQCSTVWYILVFFATAPYNLAVLDRSYCLNLHFITPVHLAKLLFAFSNILKFLVKSSVLVTARGEGGGGVHLCL